MHDTGWVDGDPGDNIKKAMVGALVESAIEVVKESKKECPYVTGTLRDSISWELEEGKEDAVVGTFVYYAPYVEFKYKSFLIAPFKKSAKKIAEIFRRWLGGAI